MLLTILKNINLAFAFFLELAVLVILGYWGWQIGNGTIAKILLCTGAIALAIIVWGIWGAPKSDWHVTGLKYLILQIVFFGAAALALWGAGQRGLSLVFVLICVIVLGLNYVWKG